MKIHNKKTKTAMTLLILSTVSVTTLGVLYVSWQGNLNANAMVGTVLGVFDKPVSPTQSLVGAHDVKILTPSEFIQQGGRSLVTIKASNPVIDVVRGSSATVTLVVTHEAINNPLPSVTILAKQIGNYYIPPIEAKSMTPHQRVEALKDTGTIPGTLNLNSTVSFSPNPIVLTPGQSKQMLMTIKIPKNWPTDVVGQEILYGTIYDDLGNNNHHDLLIYPQYIRVHITG